MKLLGGGFINKTIKILHDNNSDDGMILRINGTVGEKVCPFNRNVSKSKKPRQSLKSIYM